MRKGTPIAPTHYEVGRFYRVPCVWASWPNLGSTPGWWPVLGPQHEDEEFIDFPYQHYHVDHRFLNAKWREDLISARGGGGGVCMTFSAVITSMNIANGSSASRGGVPAFAQTDHNGTERMPEDDSWFRVRRLKCKAQWPEYPRRLARWLKYLERAYQGQKLRRGRFCPHRGTDLSTIKPDGDVVTCPLHGLCWNVRTGELVPQQFEAGTPADAAQIQ